MKELCQRCWKNYLTIPLREIAETYLCESCYQELKQKQNTWNEEIEKLFDPFFGKKKIKLEITDPGLKDLLKKKDELVRLSTDEEYRKKKKSELPFTSMMLTSLAGIGIIGYAMNQLDNLMGDKMYEKNLVKDLMAGAMEATLSHYEWQIDEWKRKNKDLQEKLEEKETKIENYQRESSDMEDVIKSLNQQLKKARKRKKKKKK